MTDTDKMFSGSIPSIYDRYLGPMLFKPYAQDLARRAAGLAPARVLETAAGTGLFTWELTRVLPSHAAITATDLNPAMLEIAGGRLAGTTVKLKPCDAQHLDAADRECDLVTCQFGVMFFPDKVAAFKEARRVLRPGGTFLFNVWDSLDENELPDVVARSVAASFPGDPPGFVARTPHGYHDIDRIRGDLDAAGFRNVAADTVRLRCKASSPQEAATGFCQGSPLRMEIEQRDPKGLARVTQQAIDAVAARFGNDAIDVPMQAIVLSAKT